MVTNLHDVGLLLVMHGVVRVVGCHRVGLNDSVADGRVMDHDLLGDSPCRISRLLLLLTMHSRVEESLGDQALSGIKGRFFSIDSALEDVPVVIIFLLLQHLLHVKSVSHLSLLALPFLFETLLLDSFSFFLLMGELVLTLAFLTLPLLFLESLLFLLRLLELLLLGCQSLLFCNPLLLGQSLLFSHLSLLLGCQSLLLSNHLLLGQSLQFGNSLLFGEPLLFSNSLLFGEPLLLSNSLLFSEPLLFKVSQTILLFLFLAGKFLLLSLHLKLPFPFSLSLEFPLQFGGGLQLLLPLALLLLLASPLLFSLSSGSLSGFLLALQPLALSLLGLLALLLGDSLLLFSGGCGCGSCPLLLFFLLATLRLGCCYPRHLLLLLLLHSSD